ncbi:MAG: CsbD family protein [Clostridiaceae bacterium]|nr:CsbD family protein [Clostridiaceae bacterium]
MTTNKKKFDRTKDKVAGEIKEAAGKITGNEQLELKGKIQSKKADLEKKMDVSEKFEDMKEDIAGKINDDLDKRQTKKNKKK